MTRLSKLSTAALPARTTAKDPILKVAGLTTRVRMHSTAAGRMATRIPVHLAAVDPVLSMVDPTTRDPVLSMVDHTTKDPVLSTVDLEIKDLVLSTMDLTTRDPVPPAIRDPVRSMADHTTRNLVHPTVRVQALNMAELVTKDLVLSMVDPITQALNHKQILALSTRARSAKGQRQCQNPPPKSRAAPGASTLARERTM